MQRNYAELTINGSSVRLLGRYQLVATWMGDSMQTSRTISLELYNQH